MKDFTYSNMQLRFRPPLGKGKKKEDLAAGGPLSTGLPALLGIGAHKWQTSVKARALKNVLSFAQIIIQ